jgi:hypothetical protein
MSLLSSFEPPELTLHNKSDRLLDKVGTYWNRSSMARADARSAIGYRFESDLFHAIEIKRSRSKPVIALHYIGKIVHFTEGGLVTIDEL